MLVRIMCAIILLVVAGCISIEEGYTARYGLTNPENPPVHPDLMDETYAGGTVGQRYIEEYEEKYRETDVFKPAEPETSETQGQEAE